MKNNNKLRILWLFAIALPLIAPAQSKLEGYVFEQNNRGFLNQVKITVYSLENNAQVAELETNIYGFFSTDVGKGKYRVKAEKDIFHVREDTVQIEQGQAKAYVKMELRRRPGYLFDATLAEMRESPDQLVDAIQGAQVEIYNRTARKTELTIENDPDAFFQYTFERGNHYTVLIRKEGYLTKRIEVYVNINGCILCVDGVRAVTPGVTENLTAGNEMGTLLANIELEKAKLDKRIQIQNIYYDYDKWNIRPDAAEQLDNVVQLMKDNPGLSVELGSHTDSRGNDDYNDQLSQKRAISAVAYIVSEGIDSLRITAKGYGERALMNRCGNDVECTETEHQQNRRTELRITGIAKGKLMKSLEQIILEEDMARATKGKAPKLPNRDKQLAEVRNEPKPPATEPAPVMPVEPLKPLLYEFENVRVLPLPAQFKGYAVELVNTPLEISADHQVFKGQKEVFHRQEPDGSHGYFIVNLGNQEAAVAAFKKRIKPANPKSKLVLFDEKGKNYLD